MAGLTLLGPPVISVQPMSRSALASTNVAFSVTASGLATLFYQWRFNQAELLGATNASLSLSNVQSAHAGAYDVVISNIYGALTSVVATLTVVPSAPVITTQPVSRVVSVGQDVSFTVAAKGTEPISCQWQRDGTNLPGATSFTIALAGANSSLAGTYRAALRNSAGLTFSTNATLIVSPVVIWGRTNNQQLSGSAAIPAAATGVVAVAAAKATEGGAPCLVLRADGTLVSWGGFSSVPANATNAIAIASGGPDVRATENNLALLLDGNVVNWNVSSKPPLPATVTNGNIVALAAGGQHQLALRTDGTVLAWGNNNAGQTNVPPALTNVIAIAAGTSHSLALRADGTLAGWGLNTSGQATALSHAADVVAIAAGGAQSLALLVDGSVTGLIVTNGAGQPLYGPPPASWTNITAIAAGLYHSLALRADGTVLGWGFTNSGQASAPVGLSNVVAISAGAYHNLALVHDPFAPPILPRFGRSPVARSVIYGQDAVFNTLALSGLPLSYQWYRNGLLLAGQTRPSLTLDNILPGSAGNYQLVAQNEFGAATSAVASVSVTLPQPYLTSLGVANSLFRFTFAGITGLNYVVEYKNALQASFWTELERRSGSGGLETIADLTSSPNSPGASRVYRIKVEVGR